MSAINLPEDLAHARRAMCSIEGFEPSVADYLLRRLEEYGIGIYNVNTHFAEKRAAPLTPAMRTALRRGVQP